MLVSSSAASNVQRRHAQFLGAKTEAAIQEDQMEEQMVIEARIREREVRRALV